MTKCWNCGNEVRADAQFCEKCGQSLTGGTAGKSQPISTSSYSPQMEEMERKVGRIYWMVAITLFLMVLLYVLSFIP